MAAGNDGLAEALVKLPGFIECFRAKLMKRIEVD